ncbi:sulfite exporter TauE/SafE family protein [Propylenella binzhouense]|uniref:Probable membrane transporter protein n=1 Tax=Propylenella binzhouense TaxID=2555902 RepID=A0A964WTL9_9HYPH|nr:sulfite exporter TauE/SafE family protein [Propylenella binzhouense]MYZ48111.1 sulfite exporter TauE/SafE family protein [Propylenella binzhouense]
MIDDPWFYLFAVPAVAIVGFGKGSFGGASAIFGVPLMSFAVSPVQAAAIMLPVLIAMDLVGLWAWRGSFDTRTLTIMFPGAAVGVAAGWLLAETADENVVRLAVGTVALLFALNHWFGPVGKLGARRHNPVFGAVCGALTGFTSFVSHAGGPTYQLYTVPLRMEPGLYVGTSIVFFAVLNLVKVPPYVMLGQFSRENLLTAGALLPAALLATLAGVKAARWMSAELFYRFLYVLVFLVSLKLLWDGITGVFG